MPTNYEWLLHMGGEERQAWFDAEHVDNQFRDATKMTNLDWLFIDSEQFRQAVSTFAFAHSDECPTSPTQMVDWLMAEHVDGAVYQSEFTNCGNPYSEGSVVLDSGIIRPIRMVDAQRDTNGTCPNDNETASNGGDSREKLEADANRLVDVFIDTYSNHSELFGKIIELLNRQAAITAKQLTSQSDAPKSEETAENAASKDDIRDFDDSREKLEADVLRYYTHTTSTLMWPEDANTKTRWVSVSMDMVLGWLDRQAEIDRKEFQTILKELKAERDVWKMKCETREVAYKQADAERKRYSEQIDELIFERDALADDLLTCNREREHLRQALGCAIDHAHEITQLVDIER